MIKIQIKLEALAMNFKIQQRIKEYKTLLLVCGVLLMIIGIAVGAVQYSQNVTESISDQVIRFHVVANSDTTDDQLLKQKVRDYVIEFIEPLLSECKSVEDTKYILEGSLPVIKEIAEEVVEDWGRDYPVYVA